MPGRSITEAKLLALSQMTENYGRPSARGLFLVFIDIEKSYDRVPRKDYGKLSETSRVLENYIRLISEM